MKTCVTCEFYASGCCWRLGLGTDPISGGNNGNFASSERGVPWPFYYFTGSCGTSGRFWSSKEKALERLQARINTISHDSYETHEK